MMDNKDAIKLTTIDERKAEIIDRLNDYEDSDLLCLFQEANSYNGYFDFVDAFYMDDIDDYVDGMSAYNIMCATVYGSVNPSDELLRFNAYGNFESLNESDLYKECRGYVDDLADWLMDNWCHVDNLYEDDEELFDTWDDIDRGTYEPDEDEE